MGNYRAIKSEFSYIDLPGNGLLCTYMVRYPSRKEEANPGVKGVNFFPLEHTH